MRDDEFRRLVQMGCFSRRQICAMVGISRAKLEHLFELYNFQQYREWYKQTLKRRVLREVKRGTRNPVIALRYDYTLNQVYMAKYRWLPKEGKLCINPLARFSYLPSHCHSF